MKDQWDTRAKWMRDVGAIDARWSEDGALISLSLGPTPASDGPPQKTSPPTPDDMKRADQERRRIATASSGRPVMRGGNAD